MERTLKRLTDYILQIAEPDKIILFGSMINEKRRNKYSDIDLLIITEHIYAKTEMTELLSNYCADLSLKVDVIIHSHEEIKYQVAIPNSFIESILNYGKIIFEK